MVSPFISIAHLQLNWFIQAVESGETPSKELLQYFAYAFKQIIEGKDARTALGLDRNSKITAEKFNRGLEITRLMFAKLNQGMSIDDSCNDIANELADENGNPAKGMSAESIKRIYYKYKPR